MADIIKLENETLKDPETGRFVKGSKPTTAIRTSEQGRALQKRRQEVREAKARAKLGELAKEGGHGITSADEYAYLTQMAAASAEANMMDRPDRAVPAAVQAFKWAGMVPQQDRLEQGAAPAVVFSEEALRMLIDLWERRRLASEVSQGGEASEA